MEKVIRICEASRQGTIFRSLLRLFLRILFFTADVLKSPAYTPMFSLRFPHPCALSAYEYQKYPARKRHSRAPAGIRQRYRTPLRRAAPVLPVLFRISPDISVSSFRAKASSDGIPTQDTLHDCPPVLPMLSSDSQSAPQWQSFLILCCCGQKKD